MNIFIVEDEIHLQEELKLLLKKRDDVTILGACASVKEALIILPAIEVDLVLMDIQLDDGKSFEILEQLNDIDFGVIFITAYNEYAIRAIKIGALDYILKPIDEQELNAALDTFKNRLNPVEQQQKNLFLEHAVQPQAVNKIVIKTIDAMFFVETQQIRYCKGDGNYTTFYLENQKEIISSKPLKEYVSLLPQNQFIKTHQSYLVNKQYVHHYNNTHELIMLDGTSVPVSMRRKDKVLEKLAE